MSSAARKFLAITVCAMTATGVFAAEQKSESAGPDIGVANFLSTHGVSGAVRTNYYRSSKSFDDAADFLGTTVQIEARPKLAANLDGKLAARASNSSIDKGGKTRGLLVEGYATFHFESADLRIGKQIVAWGRADGINPTDNLTPRDFAVMLPFEDDQRLGTPSVKLDSFLSQEHTLTLFATPYFEPSKIPLPTDGPGVVQVKPARSVSNTQLGLRLNKVGEGFDWSASYFRGFSLLPSIRAVRGSPSGQVTELRYDRITVLGADFARNLGRFGVRGEVAYMDTRDDEGVDPLVRNPQLFWIVGVDRTFLDNLNVNVQYFQRRIRHFHDPDAGADPNGRRLAIQNAVLGGQRDRVSDGVTFRVSNKWFNDTLEAEVFAVVNFTRNDAFVRPLLTYSFSDHWKATIGAEYFRGAPDTQYGGLKRNRGAFAELRYSY